MPAAAYPIEQLAFFMPKITYLMPTPLENAMLSINLDNLLEEYVNRKDLMEEQLQAPLHSNEKKIEKVVKHLATQKMSIKKLTWKRK